MTCTSSGSTCDIIVMKFESGVAGIYVCVFNVRIFIFVLCLYLVFAVIGNRVHNRYMCVFDVRIYIFVVSICAMFCHCQSRVVCS